MKVERTLGSRLLEAAKHYPIVTVTGPRQSGKTTLCRATFPDKAYASLEAPDTRAFAAKDPRGFLRSLEAGAILDEVQRVPDLLSYLQGEVDERPAAGRFILTGSANFALLGAVTQSLAGRTAVLHLLPCGLEEVRSFPGGEDSLMTTLFRGGYPAIHDRGVPPTDWHSNYVETYIQRDVRSVLNVQDLDAFHTFVRMCAGRSGGLLNLAGLGSDCGITHNTARAWLSVLEASYIVARIAPYSVNLQKRMVKTPKLHFLDSGLHCYLLGIRSAEELRHHSARGAIFESWVVAEMLKRDLHHGRSPLFSFYRDRAGNEVDLLRETGSNLLAFEVKSGETVASDFFQGIEALKSALLPSTRGSMRAFLVYAGNEAQSRSHAEIVPWDRLNTIPFGD